LEEEEGIYRDGVITIIGALADIRVAVDRILWYIEGDDEEEEDDDFGDT
jgi:hypothetical protein